MVTQAQAGVAEEVPTRDGELGRHTCGEKEEKSVLTPDKRTGSILDRSSLMTQKGPIQTDTLR